MIGIVLESTFAYCLGILVMRRRKAENVRTKKISKFAVRWFWLLVIIAIVFESFVRVPLGPETPIQAIIINGLAGFGFYLGVLVQILLEKLEKKKEVCSI